jgi:hypothetical protein
MPRRYGLKAIKKAAKVTKAKKAVKSYKHK